MKHRKILIGVGLLIVCLFIANAAKFFSIPLVDRIDQMLYDHRLQLTMPNEVDDRIVIVDVDEKSLKAEGRWPWRRDKMAKLADRLFDRYGVAVVGFDIVFAEKDESSGLNTLESLGAGPLKNVPAYQDVLSRVRPELEYDEVFANSLKNRNVVLGYYFSEGNLGGEQTFESGRLPKPVLPEGTFEGRPIEFQEWSGYGANLNSIQAKVLAGGHFSPMLDKDGVVRRIPVIAEYKGQYYEALSLAMVRALFGMPELIPEFVNDQNDSYGGLEWLRIGNGSEALRIPVDRNVSALVPYRGRLGSFNYISATDVLNDRIPAESLKNKIVLVGTSAPGLLDMRVTPVGSPYPGVEIHANMIAGILDQDIKQQPPYTDAANVMVLLVMGVFLSFLLPFLSPLKSTLVTLLAIALTIVTNVMMWQSADIALPLADGILMIVVLFVLDTSYGYFFESRTKRQITNLFGQYVPAELVEEMARQPEQINMKGESREMTILFSDVRGFTSISEAMDPEELASLMNEFLTPLSQVIYRHRGTIDKYMGDCIMAFWGAPLGDSEHARHAILAAIEMQETMSRLQPAFRERGWPEIRVGVGVNTGKVSVGNMGSKIRVAYTVMGDAVNLASRLEGITKKYGVGILVGESTRAAVPDLVYRELDMVRVKGKDVPIRIFEPCGDRASISPQKLADIDAFDKVLGFYRNQEWDKAEEQLTLMQKESPGSVLYGLYAERISYFRAHPPGEGWDGVFVFDTK